MRALSVLVLGTGWDADQGRLRGSPSRTAA